MKKVLTILTVVVLALAFVATSAFAGEMYKKEGKMRSEGKMTSEMTKASRLIGSSVHNTKGETLGKITDIAVDPESGRVSFVLLSAAGNKLTPVPIRALQISQERVVLDISKSKLATAPTFDKMEWAEMSSREGMESSYRFFGVRPYWEEGMMEQERMMERKEIIEPEEKLPGEQGSPLYRY